MNDHIGIFCVINIACAVEQLRVHAVGHKCRHVRDKSVRISDDGAILQIDKAQRLDIALVAIDVVIDHDIFKAAVVSPKKEGPIGRSDRRGRIDTPRLNAHVGTDQQKGLAVRVPRDVAELHRVHELFKNRCMLIVVVDE